VDAGEKVERGSKLQMGIRFASSGIYTLAYTAI